MTTPTGQPERSGICLDFAGDGHGTERGERPVLVAADTLCEDCGQLHDMEQCPKCGSWIGLGFGLAGGGFGEYKYCLNEACDWFWKREVEE